MAAVRRGHGSMILDLPNGQQSDLPPISALFFIYFDLKAGYTIGWKRSEPGIELEGVVEYKSLPSGLHTVKEDLIYFVHGDHAGLSAFVNAPADAAARNASMIAVGIMVPLSYGRLGRSWKHAEKLKEIASELSEDTSATELLEDFWEKNKSQRGPQAGDNSSPPDSPSSLKLKPLRPFKSPRAHSRNRSASDGTALLPPGQNLSAYHPAWSLPSLLETFGPLIFPIHREALLRRRILFTAHAPVEETCNFVYDLSVLSNLPLAISDILPPTAPPQRLRPLFSIGIHDIPLLEDELRAARAAPTTPGTEDLEDETGTGWIACTTDSILAMKPDLYDIIIRMPPPHSNDANHKVWPIIETAQGVQIKATQRDLRRYKALRRGLSHPAPIISTPKPNDDPTPDTPRTTTSHFHSPRDDRLLDIPDTDAILEPLSWSALAYSGFMWWASAGEQRLESEDEADSDNALLSGLSLAPSAPHTPALLSQSVTSLRTEGAATQEMAIIAYFHRLTTQILRTLSDIADTSESERGEDERDDDDAELLQGEDGELNVYISSADVERIGLDVWSKADHQFIADMMREYFGRQAQVEGRSVDVCGIRIC